MNNSRIKYSNNGIKFNSNIASKNANFNNNANNLKRNTERAKQLAIRSKQIAQKSIKASIRGVKVASKATMKAIKAMIEAVSSLISLIISGGAIAMIVVVIICLIGLICSSIFGIFFSSEKNGKNDTTMSSVVSELNLELAKKINELKDDDRHDDYRIISERAEWKDILTIYVAKITNGDMKQEVMTLNKHKIKVLKEIFLEYE